MSVLLATSVKVTAILLIALAALGLVRRQSASTRHWMLATAIAGALLVPLLASIVPSWRVPSVRVAGPQAESRVELSLAAVPPSAAGLPSRPRRDRPGAAPETSVAAVLITAWIAGTALALGMLALGLARLAAIAASARPVGTGRCTEIAREVASGYGLRRPVRLLWGDHPAMPVTWGLARPTVILPDAARTWSDDRLRVVLCHELAHVRRGDWGTQLAAELLRAIYWFNPIAWMACRRLRQESEHACDDAVLNAGVAGTAYASHLVDLARAYSAGRRGWSPALPVARPSGLERRVRAMLNAHLNRHPVTPGTRLATAAVFLALAGSIAGAALFAQGPFATVAGSLSDSMRGALPGATLVITNIGNKAKNEVRSDGNGRYEFVGLPPGEYVLEASLPGFSAHRTRLALNGQQVDRDIVMDVGTLQETITVTDDATSPRLVTVEELEAIEQRRARRASSRCPATGPFTGSPGGVPVGGNIRAPWKLRDVRPIYPVALKEAKVGGVVELAARIGTDGSVVEVRGTDASAHPELVSAAIDAVREWRFDETLLNCVPIEVSMTVTVSFKPRQ